MLFAVWIFGVVALCLEWFSEWRIAGWAMCVFGASVAGFLFIQQDKAWSNNPLWMKVGFVLFLAILMGPLAVALFVLATAWGWATVRKD